LLWLEETKIVIFFFRILGQQEQNKHQQVTLSFTQNKHLLKNLVLLFQFPHKT